MKIEDVMTTDVRACGPNDSLSVAAQAMWEGDCGCLPVVDAHRRVIGMITDRDICMSAHLRGSPLWSLTVGDAMAKVVYGCKPSDKLATAADLMAEHQLRRLPIIDGDDKLVGVLTIGSLTQLVAGKRKKKSSLSPRDMVELMSTVTSPRPPAVTARSVIEVRREEKAPANATPTATLKPKPRPAAKGATSASTPAKAGKDKKARVGK
jgi:CBS domain-containing protein